MEVRKLLTAIVGSALNEKAPEPSLLKKLTPEVLADLYALAKKHDLAHILSSVLYSSGYKAEGELGQKLRREEMLSVYRYERMKYAFSLICQALDGEGIAYIPLKGSVLRSFYPTESMRTSCDIDILIHEEELDDAVKALEQNGFRYGGKNYHDVSLYSEGGIHLELHFSIQENIVALDAVLKEAWSYARPADGSRFEFAEEFFVFHICAHMAYHFQAGGCGLRSLMDLWVMEHKMDCAVSRAEELLKKAGIYRFAQEMSGLAGLCFAGGDWDEFSEKLLSYIFSGGLYGCAANRIAVSKSRAGSTLVYALGRIFLPYRTMKHAYPLLKKAPVLLPFCWLARLVNRLFAGKTPNAMKELSAAGNMSHSKMDDINHIRSRLGL